MVKAIQVFKYEYAPSNATIRDKINTRKTLKRPISAMYKENNVNNLDHLETIIKNLEYDNESGVIGYIDHQHFRRLELVGESYTYQDTWKHFFFYISEKYQILIIGGGPETLRNEARDVLVQLLSNDISFISVIPIKTKEMFALVNKIKTEGPTDKKEYKNIMTDAYWKFIRINDHGGEKVEVNHMFRDEKDPRCVSKFDTFSKNLRDSNAFDPTLAIYRCNGILANESPKAHHLDIWEDARFECTSDPEPKHWVIFVTQTCKNALGIR